MDADDAYDVLAGDVPGDRSEALTLLAGEVERMIDARGEVAVVCACLIENGLAQSDVDEILSRVA